MSNKLVLVDDHAMMRDSLARVLETKFKYEILAQCASGEEAITVAQSCEPDVIIMDAKMPGMGGLESTRRISALPGSSPRIIVLTGMVDDLLVRQFTAAGADAYVTKDEQVDEVHYAIQAVISGRKFMSPQIANELALKNYFGADADSPFSQLSEREIQTATMIVQGMSVTEIAQALSVQEKTINTYRYRIFEKLNLRNDVELVLLAVKHDWGNVPQ